MAQQLAELQKSIAALADNKGATSSAYPITRSTTKDDLKAHIKVLEERLLEQSNDMMAMNETMLQQNMELQGRLKTLTPDFEMEDDIEMEIEQGHFEVKQGDTLWRVNGYSSIEPDPDYDYYPGLKMEPEVLGGKPRYDRNKVISAIVPCYTEGGKELGKSKVVSKFETHQANGTHRTNDSVAAPSAFA